LRDDRLVELIGQEALIRTSLAQLSAPLERQAVSEPERSGVVCDRLTMQRYLAARRCGLSDS
jgi:hypothetical protein